MSPQARLMKTVKIIVWVAKPNYDKTVGGGKPGAWSPVPCRYRLGHQSVRALGGRPLSARA